MERVHFICLFFVLPSHDLIFSCSFLVLNLAILFIDFLFFHFFFHLKVLNGVAMFLFCVLPSSWWFQQLMESS